MQSDLLTSAATARLRALGTPLSTEQVRADRLAPGDRILHSGRPHLIVQVAVRARIELALQDTANPLRPVFLKFRDATALERVVQ